jgi:hypothetical protein
MSDDHSEWANGQANRMIDAFASVGAADFALTLTDAEGNKVDFRRKCSLAMLRQHIAVVLQRAAVRRHNVIVRPLAGPYRLIQLDDLDAGKLERVKPAAFLAHCTSPGSYQAWVAVCGADDYFARRLRQGTGADLFASGATRIAGSRNWKAKYGPAFPAVELVHIAAGLTVRQIDLEGRGLVALAGPWAPTMPPARASLRPGSPRRFPDYARCLLNAPRKGDGRPDRSRADFFFAWLSAKWGWSVPEVAAELLRVSEKAQQNGKCYAMDTAAKAAANAEREARAGGRR